MMMMIVHFALLPLLVFYFMLPSTDCLPFYSTITKILSSALQKNNISIMNNIITTNLKQNSYHISRLTDHLRIIPRQMKLLVSSAIESMILELTMPNDDRLQEIDIQTLRNIKDQFFATVESKHINFHDHMIRKLTSKVSEIDWRTAAKSLFLVNQLLLLRNNNDDQLNDFDATDEAHHYAQSYLDRYESLRHTIESRIHDLSCLLSEVDSIDGDSISGGGSPKASILSRIAKLESWRFLLTYSKYLKQLSELISRRKLIIASTASQWASSLSRWTGGSSSSSDASLHSMTMRGSTSILQLYSEYLVASNKLIHSLGLFHHAHQQSQATNGHSSSNDLYVQLSRTVMRSIIPGEVLEASKQVLEIATSAFNKVYSRSPSTGSSTPHDQLGSSIVNMKELSIVTSVIVHSLQSISRQYNHLCSHVVPPVRYIDSQHQWLGSDRSSNHEYLPQAPLEQLNIITLELMEQYDVLSNKISATIPTVDDHSNVRVDLSSDVTHYSCGDAVASKQLSSRPMVPSRLFNPTQTQLNPRHQTAYLY